MLRQIATFAIVVASLPATAVWSQDSSSSQYANSGYHYHSQYGNTGLNTSVSYPNTPPTAPQHHASTWQEGVGRGIADIIEATAHGQLSHAQARILLAEARARELELRLAKVETEQTRRALVQREQAAQRRLKMENELLGQQLNAARIPMRHAEYRLTSSQLNRQTGEICWPPALKHEAFAADTYVLEKLFEELAVTNGSDTRYVVVRIEDACERFENTLRDARCGLNLDAQQYQHYVDCHRFILGLKYEGLVGGMNGSTYSLAAQ